MMKLTRTQLAAFLMLTLGLIGLAGAADAPATLTGKWNVTVQLPFGTSSPSFDLTQNGTQLTGTYKGVLGESPVTGTVDGASFKLSFSAAGIPCEYVGTLAGDEISGTVTLKGLGDGTFKGARAH